MRQYKQRELRELVRLGLAEDYTNTETGQLYAIIGRCADLVILFGGVPGCYLSCS